MGDSDRVEFTCNGAATTLDVAPEESLLSVLRERLHLRSVKDGCAPQGQCGCCTVLVDGAARVACVTPARRVHGRTVTTLEGLDPRRRDALAAAFVASGASQCGFCTPGIVVRAAWLLDRGRAGPPEIERALGAHLCRCTGWRTVVEAIAEAGRAAPEAARARDLDRAGTRATLEGGVAQRVGPDVALGRGGFADDDAPPGALVAVPRAPGSPAEGRAAAGLRWVVAETLAEARARAGALPGRHSTLDEAPPLGLPVCPPGGVRLATGWVEPAYLEPDASWCEPGGVAASPLANGGAFGGKARSVAPRAARALADELGRPVRVVYSREDVVRLGPKRPPLAASAVARDGAVWIEGRVVGSTSGWEPSPDVELPLRERWEPATAPGPPTAPDARAFPLAERTVLRDAAVREAGLDGAALVRDPRQAAARLVTVAAAAGGAVAGARVDLDPGTGALAQVALRVAAGDPLDEVVLRSYCVGAAHMALGWVLTEGVTVAPDSGAVLDLTIRSFGILRAQAMPPVRVELLEDAGPARPRAGDAVFAAVAAATVESVRALEGSRPETFPARGTGAARAARS